MKAEIYSRNSVCNCLLPNRYISIKELIRTLRPLISFIHEIILIILIIELSRYSGKPYLKFLTQAFKCHFTVTEDVSSVPAQSETFEFSVKDFLILTNKTFVVATLHVLVQHSHQKFQDNEKQIACMSVGIWKRLFL